MSSLQKTLCSLAIITALTACGGGSGSNSNNADSDGLDTDTTPISYTAYTCDLAANVSHNKLRIYQVMVESFIDGDTNHDYNTGYGSSHHQGDIRGVINSLDYIADLGMNAIWLTPVFESVELSNQNEWADRLDATGYFATNYFSIDPNFGTLEDARELVEQAHAKGLYVFFDGVFGHHKSNAPDYTSPQGITVSNGDVQSDTGNLAVYPDDLAFYQEVASYWITELKIDGWRLDQAYQVPIGAWGDIRKAVDEASASVTYTNSDGQTVNPLGYMVAEIWDSATHITKTAYGTDSESGVCSAFDFPMRYRVVQTFAADEGRKSSSAGGAWLNAGFLTNASNYPGFAQPNLMLGNHDLVRFGDLLQRNDLAEPGSDEYQTRHKAAYAFLAAWTGPITLYYGEEIGDQVDGFADYVDCNNDDGVGARAGLCDDHVARSSAKIEGIATQVGGAATVLTAQQSLLRDRVRELMTMRSQNSALYQGKRTNIAANADFYIDHKQDGDNIVLYVQSTSDTTQNISFTGSEIGSDGQLVDLLGGSDLSISGDKYGLTLDPFQARFFTIISPTIEGPQPGAVSGAITGSGIMAACDNPTVTGGPLTEPLYVVGDFADSSWEHVASRQMEYKGDNLYQAVVDEHSGGFNFQIAAASWDVQFTWESHYVELATEQTLTTGGYGTNTQIVVPQDGQYVYSVSLNDSGKPQTAMVSLCN